MEIWKNIENYEGYQVSNLGRVKSVERDVVISNGNIRHQDERILRPGKNKDGYLKVILCKNKERKSMKVHRLVAQAFIDNPNNYIEVNHIDEDKTNNYAENLEWCDRSYNMNFGTRNKRSAETQKNDPKKSKKVYQYSLDGVLIKEWESTMECERNCFWHGAVAACCNNKFNHQGNNIYKGFIWTYTKKENRN